MCWFVVSDEKSTLEIIIKHSCSRTLLEHSGKKLALSRGIIAHEKITFEIIGHTRDACAQMRRESSSAASSMVTPVLTCRDGSATVRKRL